MLICYILYNYTIGFKIGFNVYLFVYDSEFHWWYVVQKTVKKKSNE